jgi:hypothetical protein
MRNIFCNLLPKPCRDVYRAQCVRKRKSEAGQAVVIVVLAIGVFLLGAVGLAIDGSHLYAERQMAQPAADAAALGGILSIFHGTNATATHPFATTSPGSAYTCSTTDGTTPCAYARANGFGGTTGDTVSVSFPTAVSGVTLASASVPAITVAVQRSVNTTLMRLLGPSSFTVSTTATAALVKLPIVNCIDSLDPSASGAFSVVGNSTLNLSGCGIGVDSSSSSAFTATGNTSIQAGAVNVVGGVSLQGSNVSVTPSPTTNASTFSDPLASVPAPSAPTHCDYWNTSYSGNSITLSPGIYCNGLSFSGSVNVTFNPGTYILLGGGLTTSGNASMSGSNLTFYNTFNASYSYAPISISGNGSVNLSATTSGSLAGMLFFQDRNAPAGPQSFTGNSNQTLVGALYFPRSQLNYTGNSASTIENISIIANKVSFTGNASLKADPTQPGAAQQIKIALVQ